MFNVLCGGALTMKCGVCGGRITQYLKTKTEFWCENDHNYILGDNGMVIEL